MQILLSWYPQTFKNTKGGIRSTDNIMTKGKKGVNDLNRKI